jgi:hypothetical protein
MATTTTTVSDRIASLRAALEQARTEQIVQWCSPNDEFNAQMAVREEMNRGYSLKQASETYLRCAGHHWAKAELKIQSIEQELECWLEIQSQNECFDEC